MAIDILPDDALLEIFSSYLVETSEHIEPWLPLVHVCRRWRSIIFASPRRLDVRVFYTPERQVKVMLDIWQNLPIHISRSLADAYKISRYHHESNLIAALERTNRISQIQLKGFPFSELERILAAMQKPFPALTSLDIECCNENFLDAMPVLPEAFLGGSAQHLRSCNLSDVEFPGIWKLLLTASHLVTLRLWDIPHSMYPSPEGMATCLSMNPNLESLSIGFKFPQSLPNRLDQPNRLLSPLTRVVLPSLTKFEFRGMSECLEDFVSRIDVPLLNNVDITSFDQPISHTSRLHDFLARIEKFKAPSRGRVTFWAASDIRFELEFELELGFLSIRISCGELGRQVSSMARLFGSSIRLPSASKRLDVLSGFPRVLDPQDEVDRPQWLDTLHSFTGLKDLHLGKGLVLCFALALQELAGQRVTEVLPALQNLFIQGLEPSGPIREAFEKFAAARQQSGLPVVINSWDGPT